MCSLINKWHWKNYINMKKINFNMQSHAIQKKSTQIIYLNIKAKNTISKKKYENIFMG